VMNRHISELTQDVIDMSRQVITAVDQVSENNLASHLGLAREEEIARACDALRASWNGLNRLRVIAERCPQKKPAK
jgi:hypothetical protein